MPRCHATSCTEPHRRSNPVQLYAESYHRLYGNICTGLSPAMLASGSTPVASVFVRFFNNFCGVVVVIVTIYEVDIQWWWWFIIVIISVITAGFKNSVWIPWWIGFWVDVRIHNFFHLNIRDSSFCWIGLKGRGTAGKPQGYPRQSLVEDRS